MKILIFVVLTILILSLSFSQILINNTVTENILSEENSIENLQVKSINLLDTSYDLPPDNGVTDIANMFNERGFYKSNESALKWGEGPTIKVSELEAFGEFTMFANSDELRISESLVNQFENSSGDESDVYLFLIGTTILHELTHYGVDLKGIEYFDANKLTPAEHGEFFEKEAYGSVIGNFEKAINVLNEYNERRKLAKRYYREYFIDETIITPKQII
ncbi:MAG: hypothetical protein M3R36_12665 [Bacteroidota bacterium]|nr:hypothetical protein [Bacteroidota bacterium]